MKKKTVFICDIISAVLAVNITLLGNFITLKSHSAKGARKGIILLITGTVFPVFSLIFSLL